MSENENRAWLVMLYVDPVTKHGVIEGTTLDVSYTGMGKVEIGWVRDDGQTALDAAEKFREFMPPEQRERVRQGKVARITEIEEITLANSQTD